MERVAKGTVYSATDEKRKDVKGGGGGEVGRERGGGEGGVGEEIKEEKVSVPRKEDVKERGFERKKTTKQRRKKERKSKDKPFSDTGAVP